MAFNLFVQVGCRRSYDQFTNVSQFFRVRLYATNREQANQDGGIHQAKKFFQSVMVWLGMCYEDVNYPIIIEKGIVNHQFFFNKILFVALKCG